MKIKPGFTLRSMMGQNIVVPEGVEQVNFNKIISLNESAALLWKQVEGKEFTPETLADILVAEYGIDKDTALADSKEIAESWKKSGLTE